MQNETDERVALNALQDFIFAEQQSGISREVVRKNAEKVLTELDEKIISQINKEPELKKIYKGIKGEGSLVEGATKIRNQIDNLSNRIIDSDDFIDDELKQVIKENRGFYGTRIYRSFNDVDFDPFKGVHRTNRPRKKKAYDNAIKELKATQPKSKPIDK